MRPCLLLVTTVVLVMAGTSSAVADEFIFRPAIGLDQRFDDNYGLVQVGEDEVSATRLLTDLRLSRETPIFSFEGIARADLRLEIGDSDDSDPQTNLLGLVDLEQRFKRARASLDVQVTRDTPSRDIVSDVTDITDVAVDSGVVTQSFDVERVRADFKPSLVYDVSRRTSISGSFTYTQVDHETPSVQETLFDRYQRLLTSGGDNPPTPETRPELFDENGEVFTQETVSTDQTGSFTPTGELDDYRDISVDLTYRYKLDRISTVSATVGYSELTADEEADVSVLTSGDLIADESEPQIRRAPRRESKDTTTSFRLGYQRAFTQTLNVGLQVGVYANTSDDTELFRFADGTLSTDEDTETDADGYLASISFDKDSGLTRYSVRYAIDVLPSSVGSRVETNELVGQVFRTITPLIDVSLRGQAYEPDRLGSQANDRFARRFISLEPRIVWRFKRDWTLGVAYRYRRQKARVDADSSESNAVLFSIRYLPPSKIADTVASQ